MCLTPCLNPRIGSSFSQIVYDYAARQGCIAGLCHAAPLAREPYEAAGFVPFVSTDLRKRTEPERSLKGAASIVVLGVPQAPGGGHNETQSVPKSEQLKTAQLSSLGRDADYHIRVRELLRGLADALRACYDFRYKILVDSPGLDERALAVRAGLGYIGKHGLVISAAFGSRFNIGCLLTDIPFVSESIRQENALLQECPPQCRRCIDACPTGALSAQYPQLMGGSQIGVKGTSPLAGISAFAQANVAGAAPHGFAASRCLSFLTQKESLSPSEEALLYAGRQLYGCDICQDACPRNTPRAPAWVNPADWLAMDDEAFSQAYGHTASAWRGPKLLRRNARILMKELP